jgi:hypothetical protein
MREERYCLDHLDLDWDFNDVNSFDYCPKCGRRMIVQMQPEPEYDSNFKPLTTAELGRLLENHIHQTLKRTFGDQAP